MKECISSSTGKPRSCYSTYEDALNSADYMRITKGMNFYPYKCNKCGFYHLAPQQDKINFLEHGCSCRDSEGNRKNLYETYEDAVKAKGKAEAKRDVVLKIYKCPERDGWHLTHIDKDISTGENTTIKQIGKNNEKHFPALGVFAIAVILIAVAGFVLYL